MFQTSTIHGEECSLTVSLFSQITLLVHPTFSVFSVYCTSIAAARAQGVGSSACDIQILMGTAYNLFSYCLQYECTSYGRVGRGDRSSGGILLPHIGTPAWSSNYFFLFFHFFLTSTRSLVQSDCHERTSSTKDTVYHSSLLAWWKVSGIFPFSYSVSKWLCFYISCKDGSGTPFRAGDVMTRHHTNVRS